jgi:biotin synthase-related radical SAM superfamily protein
MVDVYQGVAAMLKAGDLRSEQMSAGCAKCGACSALSLFEQVS